jgi:hypothetical protein
MEKYTNTNMDVQLLKYAETKEKVGRGVSFALRAYKRTLDEKLDIYTVWETPFSTDMNEFIKTIETAGVAEFHLAESSSGLKVTLIHFLNSGWAVGGAFEKEVDGELLDGLIIQKIQEGGEV